MEDILADIDTSALIGKIVFLAVVIGVALLVQRIVVHGLKRALDAAGVPKASIFVNIVRAVIWVFALLAVLEPVFGVQPTAFVAALGVTSVVISFGLQDTVSNIIAGLGLMMGRCGRFERNGTDGAYRAVSGGIVGGRSGLPGSPLPGGGRNGEIKRSVAEGKVSSGEAPAFRSRKFGGGSHRHGV